MIKGDYLVIQLKDKDKTEWKFWLKDQDLIAKWISLIFELNDY